MGKMSELYIQMQDDKWNRSIAVQRILEKERRYLLETETDENRRSL